MINPARPGHLLALTIAVHRIEEQSDEYFDKYMAASPRDEHRMRELWLAADRKRHAAMLRRDKAAAELAGRAWLRLVVSR